MQPGFPDQEDRLTQLEKLGDPLPRLDSSVDWSTFRPLLKVIHQKQRTSNAGRKPHDVTLMFKMLVLQALYKLSDDQAEFQVRDRLSFQRFDEQLRKRGYESRIHRKGSSRRKLNQQEQATNHRRSKVRARVEHVFGDQRTRQGNILVRTKGKVRAAVKIGLMNLTYNMRRLEFLLRPQSACCPG